MGMELFFWALTGVGCPVMLIYLVWVVNSQRAAIKRLSLDVLRFWLQWPLWSRGQRLFMALGMLCCSLLVMLVARLGAMAAELAAIEFGGLTPEQAITTPPLGSWELTMLVVLAGQLIIVSCLEYRRLTNVPPKG